MRTVQLIPIVVGSLGSVTENLDKSGAPNDGFLLIALKTLFRLSRVLLVL